MKLNLMKISGLLIGTALLAASVPAQAQDGDMGMRRHMEHRMMRHEMHREMRHRMMRHRMMRHEMRREMRRDGM